MELPVWVALQVPGEVGGHTEAYTHLHPPYSAM